jgi:Helix-turn-helix domain
MPSASAPPARWLSPPDVAAQLGIDPEKVIGWIRRGELNAVNVAAGHLGGRPRFRINPDDLAEFLRRRSTLSAPKPARTRRKQGTYTPKYFQ